MRKEVDEVGSCGLTSVIPSFLKVKEKTAIGFPVLEACFNLNLKDPGLQVSFSSV
jgi:hypothetical protein